MGTVPSAARRRTIASRTARFPLAIRRGIDVEDELRTRFGELVDGAALDPQILADRDADGDSSDVP